MVVSLGHGHSLASLVLEFFRRRERSRCRSRRQRRASSLCFSGPAWRAGMLARTSRAAAPPPVPPPERPPSHRAAPPTLDPGTARPRPAPWRAGPPLRGRGLPVVVDAHRRAVSLLPRRRRFSVAASVVSWTRDGLRRPSLFLSSDGRWHRRRRRRRPLACDLLLPWRRRSTVAASVAPWNRDRLRSPSPSLSSDRQ